MVSLEALRHRAVFSLLDGTAALRLYECVSLSEYCVKVYGTVLMTVSSKMSFSFIFFFFNLCHKYNIKMDYGYLDFTVCKTYLLICCA